MFMPPWRKVLLGSCLFAALTALATGLVGIAGNSATEAPAGFNTPSFNSTASINNGLVEPPGDTFARDQQVKLPAATHQLAKLTGKATLQAWRQRKPVEIKPA